MNSRLVASVLGFVFLGASLSAEVPKFTGQIEWMATSGRFAGANKSRDRYLRVSGRLDLGDWQLKASYWDYAYCNWYDIDETHLQYSKGNHTLKVGRMLVPLGQTNWYEQWYSGFNALPKLESNWYGGRALLERTSPGLQWDVQLDPKQSLQICIFGGDPNYGRPSWKKLNRGVARYQIYEGDLILGLSALTDHRSGRSEQAQAVDARWSRKALTVRGTMLRYAAAKGKAKGFYLDVMFRPKGSDKVTLVGRIEGFETLGKKRTTFDTYTVGIKVRLPFQFTGTINYMGGSGVKNLMIGGGWSIGFARTFRF